MFPEFPRQWLSGRYQWENSSASVFHQAGSRAVFEKLLGILAKEKVFVPLVECCNCGSEKQLLTPV
jgi:hypothetical protein